METSENIQGVSELQVVVTTKDGTIKVVGIEELTRLIVENGNSLKLVKKLTESNSIVDNFIVLKDGETLGISFTSGESLTIENFYSYDNIEITFEATNGSIYTISSVSTLGQELLDGTVLVYAQGNQQALLDMVKINEPLHNALNEHLSI